MYFVYCISFIAYSSLIMMIVEKEVILIPNNLSRKIQNERKIRDFE